MSKRRVYAIDINQEWCKRCGICSAFCPVSVFTTDLDGTVSVACLDACVACELCERTCPDLAIQLNFVPRTSETQETAQQ